MELPCAYKKPLPVVTARKDNLQILSRDQRERFLVGTLDLAGKIACATSFSASAW